MQEKCKDHPEKQALSLCHNCSNYFCSDCLVEGSEYYYCKSPDCIKAYEQNEIVNNVKKEYKEHNKLLYDLKKSPVPFISISFILALFLCVKLGYFEEGFIKGILLSFLLGIVIWGLPFILTILLGLVITRKEYRSKIFYILYTVIWIIIIFLYLIGSGIV